MKQSIKIIAITSVTVGLAGYAGINKIWLTAGKQPTCPHCGVHPVSKVGLHQPLIGGAGPLPPAYLNITGWPHCLGRKNQGTWISVCLPHVKPATCLSHAWAALQKKSLALPPCSVPPQPS
jgi:hypothetical protein